MKYVKKLSGLLIISLLCAQARTENPCGVMTPNPDTSSWGIGCIRLTIHDQIKGLTRDNKVCTVGNGFITLGSSDKVSLKDADFLYVADFNTILLKVREVKNNRYKIATESLKGGIWVEQKELRDNALRFETYYSFIQRNKNLFKQDGYEKAGRHVNMGVNLFASRLYLRDKPGLNGGIIACLKNNLQGDPKHTTTHLEIREVKNGWAYVMVRIYIYDENKNPQPDECASTLINEYAGYVKVIGNKGIPNIWYALSAY